LLLEFQRDFAAAISASAEGPLRVYRNTVLSGCVDALRANYPVVAALLGEEMFESVAAQHATECPPRKPVLALYGAHFPAWLEGQSWVRDLRYVPDVARIERLQIEALFACDADPLEMTALAGRDDWQSLQLPLHPAARFDWLTSPATSIWLAHRDGVEGELDLDWHAEGVLFTRPALEVRPIRLERAGHRFLFGIRLGESVGAAAIAAANLYPETDIGSLFTSLVECGAFVASTHRS
jgi:hypothetical protein